MHRSKGPERGVESRD
uniref:Uncharacterized protein n=1 Tax=Rhizophora mucronata TaxID=61149 RepID=A0A2P2N5X6_RHIMU